MHPDNIETGKQFGLRQRFKVCTDAHYLGSFIGDDESNGIGFRISRQCEKITFTLSEK